jgi:Ca2+-binding RTX toxin-like protein
VDASTATSGELNVDLSASTNNLNINNIVGPPGTPTSLAFSIENFANVTGTARNDVITGNNGNNILIGGAGDDNIGGLGGNDFLSGLSGRDTLRGDDGLDTVFGGSENDVLLGGQGNDFLAGGSGDDNITGDAGNDALYGGSGIDVLTGTNASSRGVGEVDFLSGGTGGDSFVLGDERGAYYLGNGANDFARISDYSANDQFVLGRLRSNQVYQVQSTADGFNLFVRDRNTPASRRDLIAAVSKNPRGFIKTEGDDVAADPTDQVQSAKELQSDFTIPVIDIKGFSGGEIQKLSLQGESLADQPTQVSDLSQLDLFAPGIQEFTLTSGQSFGNFVSL